MSCNGCSERGFATFKADKHELVNHFFSFAVLLLVLHPSLWERTATCLDTNPHFPSQGCLAHLDPSHIPCFFLFLYQLLRAREHCWWILDGCLTCQQQQFGTSTMASPTAVSYSSGKWFLTGSLICEAICSQITLKHILIEVLRLFLNTD